MPSPPPAAPAAAAPPPDAERIPLEAGELDLPARVLRRHDGGDEHLTPTEVALVRWLAAAGGAPVTRAELLREVWGYREGVRTRTIDTTIRRLRAKLERVPALPRHIETVEGLGYRFVPLAALQVAGATPAELDATVGRAGLLAQLDAAAAGGARLITLTGPGGIGKTRVALAWARGRPALLVEAEALAPGPGSGEALLAAVAAAAGLRPGVGGALAAGLGERGVELLVLDNLEHLLPEAAEAARAVAQGGARVLCTSRHRLQLPDELVIEVPPLDEPDAVALLRARAPAAFAGAADEDLREIAHAVDRMPLALELAAGRADLLGAPGLRARLASPLDLLHREGGPCRQRSLRAVLEWSWAALDAAARADLLRLTALRAGAQVPVAEAILGGPDPLSRLQHLRDRSWLRAWAGPTGARRVGLLAPLRAFLAEQGPPPAEAVARHARAFAAAGEDDAREALERGEGGARRELRADLPELLHAADVALACPPGAELPGAGPAGPLAARLLLAAFEALRLQDDPRALLPRTLAALSRGDLPPCDHAQLLILDVDLQRASAPVDRTRAALARAWAAADGHPALRARARATEAVVLQERGDTAAALPVHHEALALAEAAGARRLVGTVHSNLGNLHNHRGELDLGQAHLAEAVRLLDAEGCRRLAAVARGNLAVVLHEQGQLLAAEDAYTQALRAQRSLGNMRYVAILEGNLGQIALDRGELDRAHDHLALARRLHRECGNVRCEAIVALAQAELLRCRARPEAASAAEEAWALAERAGDGLALAVVDALRAELEADERPARARERAEAAWSRCAEMGAEIEAAIAEARLGRVLCRCGEPAGAATRAEGARAVLRTRGLSPMSELGRHLAELDRALGAGTPTWG